jgi:DNA-binding NtrC family response regulator
MAIHVLLVDEDLDVLDVTEAFLGREDDLAVSTEPDPTRAVERVGEDGIDAVVTDLTMPKLDGFELASAVDDRYEDVPVFIFTGRDPRDLDDEAGVVTGFVRKGAGTDQYERLAEQVREAV